jgi:hypothetical protein
MYARLSDQELFDRSDLIVKGVLIGETRIRSGSVDLVVGVIQIQETLKGSNARVALLAFPAPGQPVSSSDLRYPVGASGLWYLRLRGESELGIYLADHPQRYVPAAEAQEALKALRQRRDTTSK